MSQENVEALRRAVELWNTRGEEAIETIGELWHPDAEARDLQPAPGTAEVMQGRSSIVAVWRQWLEEFDDWRVEVDDVVDADPWVVSDVQWHASGKGSEVAIDWRVTEAHEFKDGQIVRSLFGFPSMAAALDAVGRAGSLNLG